MTACLRTDAETISLLLERGADYRRHNESGQGWVDFARRHPQNKTLAFVLSYLKARGD